jgi:hypothetical protein
MYNALIKPSYTIGEIHYYLTEDSVKFLKVESVTAKTILLQPVGTHVVEVTATNNKYRMFSYTPTAQFVEGSSVRLRHSQISDMGIFLAGGYCLKFYFEPVRLSGARNLNHAAKRYDEDLVGGLRQDNLSEVLRILKNPNYTLNTELLKELRLQGITDVTKITAAKVLEISKNNNSILYPIIGWNEESVINRFLDEKSLASEEEMSTFYDQNYDSFLQRLLD